MNSTFGEMEDYRKKMLREGKSRSTVDAYIRDLAAFFSWLDEQTEDPIPLGGIRKNHVNGYIDHLINLGRAITSRNRHLSAITNFFRFLAEEEVIPFNPADTVKSAKVPKRLPKPIPEKDISKLSKVIVTAMEKAMIELLYGSGVRREELISIRIDNIDLDIPGMTVIGKGDKERFVPISASAVPYIQHLIDTQNSIWLFPSPKKGYESKHISLRYVNKLVSKWAKAARLNPSKITPHKFRHSFATDLLNGGADMAVVSEFMGHANPATTKIYGSVSKQRSMEVYKSAHPRAKAR